MMSPKTKLVVGGVGAAAVTSSVVMSSVALATQGTSIVQEDKKTTEVTKQEFEDLKNRVTALEQADTAADESNRSELEEKIKTGLENIEDSHLKMIPKFSEDETYKELKGKVDTLETTLKEVKTKVEKSGVDVSKHPSVIALEQQAQSFKSSLTDLNKKLSDELKEQDEKIKDEVEGIRHQINNDVNIKLEEMKELNEEIKKIDEELRAIKKFSDANKNNEYMATLAEHAQKARTELRKEMTDMRNKWETKFTELQTTLEEIKNKV